MSGPSTYTPNSGFEKWLDQRLPLPRLMHDTMRTYPTPKNLNFWYVFGGILTFCLAVQIVSGIVLAMHYKPDSALAFSSTGGPTTTTISPRGSSAMAKSVASDTSVPR